MSNFNKVILAGNLTRDPDLKYTPKGSAVASFGLAINRNWTTESGEKREEVTFVDITAFGKTAEVIQKFFLKGKPMLMEGRLKLDSWDDKATGAKRSKLGVELESFSVIGGEKPADGPAQARRPATASAPAAPATGENPPEDDVPF